MKKKLIRLNIVYAKQLRLVKKIKQKEKNKQVMKNTFKMKDDVRMIMPKERKQSRFNT